MRFIQSSSNKRQTLRLVRGSSTSSSLEVAAGLAQATDTSDEPVSLGRQAARPLTGVGFKVQFQPEPTLPQRPAPDTSPMASKCTGLWPVYFLHPASCLLLLKTGRGFSGGQQHTFLSPCGLQTIRYGQLQLLCLAEQYPSFAGGGDGGAHLLEFPLVTPFVEKMNLHELNPKHVDSARPGTGAHGMHLVGPTQVFTEFPTSWQWQHAK